MTLTEIESQSDLEEIVEGEQSVVVEFYAEWCGPCKTLSPILETLAAETDIEVGIINVEEQQLLAQEYDIRGIPTMIFFSEGEQVDRLTGVRQQEEIEGVFAGHQAVEE